MENKAVLISIKPEWCAKIASGGKTLELRKTVPKAFIKNAFFESIEPFKCYIYCTFSGPVLWLDGKPINSRVIGEFVCDYILCHCDTAYADVAERDSLVPREDIRKYGNGKEVFGWHIRNLMIYDEPRRLQEFGLERPPQSWCYVDNIF